MLRNTLLFLSRSTAAKKLVTETPLRGMARRFVPGESVDDLLAAIREANAQGFTATGNYLGESVLDEVSARAAAATYLDVLQQIEAEDLDANISLKFTQMGQDISEDVLAENLVPVLERASGAGIFIRFDMESSDYTQRTLDAFELLWAEGWRGIGVVLQSYLHRTLDDARRMNELGARVRICKGAYAEPPEVAYQDSREVGRNFLEVARLLLAEGNYPGIATHDERMIDGVLDFVTREGIAKDDFEFQMLHGVRRDLQRQLVADGFRMRLYIPFGEAWYPYLMRRLAERPANVLFMAGSVIKESPLGFLWPDGKNKKKS